MLTSAGASEVTDVYSPRASSALRTLLGELSIRDELEGPQIYTPDEATLPSNDPPIRVVVAQANDPSYLRLPRRLADMSVDHLQQMDPDLFADILPEQSLRDLFCLTLTFRLATEVLPGLLGFLADGRRRRRRTLLVDTGLSPRQVRVAEEFLGMAPTEGPLECHSTVKDHLLSKVHKEFRRGQPAAADPAETLHELPDDAAILLCGSATELAYLRPATEALTHLVPVVVLAKNDRPDTRKACDDLRQAGAERVLPSGVWTTVRGHRRTLTNVVSATGRLAETDARLQGSERAFWLHNLALLFADVRLVLALEQIVEACQPTIVGGAMDRNIYGVAFGQLRSRADFRVVNFQHGTMMPYGTMDLTPFDRAFVWNDAARDIMLGDGYRDADTIRVVGNPAWDALADLPTDLDSAAAAGLREWKGDARLVLALPQPAKGPFLTRQSLQTFWDLLSEYVLSHHDVKLAVKLRAREQPIPDSAAFRELAAMGRMRVLPSKEFSLAEALSCADVAVSIYSTALADAVAAGIPAVSIDADGILERFPADFGKAVIICRSSREISSAFDRLLTDDNHVSTASITQSFIPQFTRSYAHRLGQELRDVL